MAEFFPHCPEALENTRQVASLCRTDWDFSRTIFPAFRELRRRLSLRGTGAPLPRRGAVALRHASTKRWRRGSTRSLPSSATRASPTTSWWWRRSRSSRSAPAAGGAPPPRWSPTASASPTSIPIRHNLFFERFLNEGRTDPPDIDIDFPWDERDAILDFAFARYGAKRAAMVANQVGFKGRSALREVAKVYGLPDTEIKEMTERISGFWKADQSRRGDRRASPFPGREALRATGRRSSSTAQRLQRAAAPPVAALRRAGHRAGRDPQVRPGGALPQGAAAHPVGKGPGGGRGAGEDRHPRQPLAGGDPRCHGGGEGTTAAWRSITPPGSRWRTRRPGRSCGAAAPSAASIWSPPRSACCCARSGASTAPARPWRSTSSRCWCRPPPSSGRRPTASSRSTWRGCRGKPWDAPPPAAGEVLDETFGIAIYQEQITQIAMALAGFSACEGDQLRKVITKKHREKRLADFRRHVLRRRHRHKGCASEVLEADLGADPLLFRLLLLQAPLGQLCPLERQGGLHEGPLPGRVHGGGDLQPGRLLLGIRLHFRMPPAGSLHPPARHQ